MRDPNSACLAHKTAICSHTTTFYSLQMRRQCVICWLWTMLCTCFCWTIDLISMLLLDDLIWVGLPCLPAFKSFYSSFFPLEVRLQLKKKSRTKLKCFLSACKDGILNNKPNKMETTPQYFYTIPISYRLCTPQSYYIGLTHSPISQHSSSFMHNNMHYSSALLLRRKQFISAILSWYKFAAI